MIPYDREGVFANQALGTIYFPEKETRFQLLESSHTDHKGLSNDFGVDDCPAVRVADGDDVLLYGSYRTFVSWVSPVEQSAEAWRIGA